MSRQKVSVKANSSWDFGKTNTFELNRYGILAGLVLKLTVSNSGSEAAAGFGLNAGNMLVRRATLSSHSREIEQVLDVMNLTQVLEMPLGAKQALMDLAKNDNQVLAAGDNEIYVPLNFSFCRNGLSMALDLSFVEKLECVVELGSKLDAITGTQSEATLDAADCELICYYYNLSESDLRKYEDAEFSIERPLSIMGCSTYRENTVQSASGSAEDRTVTINFNCPNVVTKTVIGVHKTSVDENDKRARRGAFQAIKKVEFFMSGRLVYEYTDAANEFKLENALFYGSSYGIGDVGADGATGTDDSQNLYTHNWGVSNEKSRFSGGVSGKNVSDFSAKITFAAAASTAYEIECQHEYISICSISGASGKIGVSLSL